LLLRASRARVDAMEGYEPLHFESSSVEIGSSFGGASWIGVFGSNLEVMFTD